MSTNLNLLSKALIRLGIVILLFIVSFRENKEELEKSQLNIDKIEDLTH